MLPLMLCHRHRDCHCLPACHIFKSLKENTILNAVKASKYAENFRNKSYCIHMNELAQHKSQHHATTQIN